MNPDLYDEICKLAYELYERSGRCDGRDAENWLEAERIVIARYVLAEEPEPAAAQKASKKAPAKRAAKKPQAAKVPKEKAAPKAKKTAKTGE